MKKFTWRLQRVLDLTATKEQIKISEVNQVAQTIAAAKSNLVSLKLKLQDMLEDSKSNLKGRLTEHELFMNSIAHNDQAIRQLMEAINLLQNDHKKKMEELLEIRRYKEGLEKLRQKAKDSFNADQQAFEQAQMDERTTIDFARKKMLQMQ